MTRHARRTAKGICLVLLVFITSGIPPAAAQDEPNASVERRITALVPDIESYIANGMKAFDVPGLAIGIVAGDRLIYAKGFGVRSKASALPVDARTVFQIGSTTKAFLAATMAIMVDRGKFRWDDRVVDLYPDFQMKDPWVTREFRVFDIMAQRSGLPNGANDALGLFAFGETDLIRSLRYVEPVSSFRSTFGYTNLTHLLAGRIVANAANAPDWNAVLQRELLDPLGMRDSSYTAEAIEAAPNHAKGHHWTPEGVSEVPFTRISPYGFGAAGDLNSTVEDMARWVRLQLGNGTFEERRIVSPEGIAYTHTAKVAINDTISYALGWFVRQTPHGTTVWHDGDAVSFGSFVGLVPDKNVGIIVLTNKQNVGFPNAIGVWLLDRILDNPEVDYVTIGLAAARTRFETTAALFAKPSIPRPFPPLSSLAGVFVHPAFGTAIVTQEANSLIVEFRTTGAKLELKPWDGDVFTFRLMPIGRFAAVAALDSGTKGFAEFQIDKDGKLNALQLGLRRWTGI